MSSESEISANFWGDMPEEEYYASQGVRNTKSYFDTPNGKLFTQSFLPLDLPVKASVYMTHGYGSDTGWLFQKICINYATWGYAVFAADILGHGRSDGIRCYLGDMEKVAATSLSFFKSVRTSESYRDLPAFLFGESMGGATTMLVYFQSEPELWTGLIFSAPLFVMPENMKPSKVRLFLYGLLFGMADTWATMPDNKMVGKAIKDPEKLKVIASNPRRYTGPPRVGTMRELARVCQYIQDNFSKVTAPFLTVHGTADGVTCPTSSKLLYEKASSEDKALKLYEGMYHSLIQGEPDENSNLVLKDTFQVYNLHRSPYFWDRPHEFEPERFLVPRNSDIEGWSGFDPSRSPGALYPNEIVADFAFLPFGGGPRKCVGDQFALMESTIALTMLLQKFDVELKGGPESVELVTGATIHTKNGLWCRMMKRSDLH